LIKGLVISAIRGSVRTMRGSAAGRYLLDQIVRAIVNSTTTVRHREVALTFAVPNRVNHLRATTLSTKEPETLAWIDGMPEGAVFWDVGANVGLYSCYAARARRCEVCAFEPSVFNLEVLARNVHLNRLTDRVTIVPLPLSDARGVSTLNMTTTDWGGAFSTFGQAYGHDGQPLRTTFEFRTAGLSMAGAAGLLGLPQPQYIKMDVDGIEHLILKGGADVLRQVSGVLIEVNEEFDLQARDCARYLTEAGLVLKEKLHAEMFEGSIFKNTYNQIWQRPAR
jgi:FkbM family methyltransferase